MFLSTQEAAGLLERIRFPYALVAGEALWVEERRSYDAPYPRVRLRSVHIVPRFLMLCRAGVHFPCVGRLSRYDLFVFLCVAFGEGSGHGGWLRRGVSFGLGSFLSRL